MPVIGHISRYRKILKRRSTPNGWRGFFTAKITIARWKINVFGLTVFSIGAVAGAFFAIANLVQVHAAPTTGSAVITSTAEFDAGTFSGTVSQDIDGGEIRLSGSAGPDGTIYRRPITINNSGNASTLTDYQALVVVDTAAIVLAGKMQGDCRDLRFRDSTEVQNLSYWIESGCNTATTRTWVKVPSIAGSSSTTIVMYYGAAGASAQSSGTDTFLFYDDFTGHANGTSPDGWRADDGTWTVQNGEYYNSAGSQPVATSTVFPEASTNYIMDAKAKYVASYYVGLMPRHTGTGATDSGYYMGPGLNGTQVEFWKRTTGNWTQQGTTTPISGFTDGQFHLMTAIMNGSTISFNFDNVFVKTYTDSSSPLLAGTIALHTTGKGYYDDIRVRKFTSPEPTASVGVEGTTIQSSGTWTSAALDVGAPAFAWVDNANGNAYEASVTVPSNTSVAFRVRTSANGSSWGSWVALTDNDADAGRFGVTKTALSTAVPILRYLQIEATLSQSDGASNPTLSDLTFNYQNDVDDPSNPVLGSAQSAVSGGTDIVTGSWYNHAAPTFTWTGAADADSGVAGYWVYFGTDPDAIPKQAGTYQIGTSFTAGSLSSGYTYYLRLTTKDSAGNPNLGNGTAVTLFTYKFDATPPSNPSYVAAAPAGYSATDSFSFLWPAVIDPLSGLATAGGYCYKTGAAGATDTCTTATLVEGIASYQTGANVFYLRTLDQAGNVNASYVQVTYYYNPDAPSAPPSLTVTPANSTKNSFAFSWGVPTVQTGSVASYRYSVNAKPTATNTSATALSALPAGPYATQVGENVFYVVAVSDTGIVNYDNPASVTFTATTAAPAVPIAVSIADATNRAEQLYALTISWKAPDPLPDDFSGYVVERTIVDVGASSVRTLSEASYTKIAQVTTTIYSDAGLDPTKTYSYRVKTIDTTSNVSAASTSVSKTPTGKFTDAPAITKGPSIEAKSTSATLVWTTDRAGTSLVQCGPTTSYGISAGQLDAGTEHEVTVKGLTPGATYHCRVQTTDVPELVDYSTTDKGFSPDVVFKTLDAPGLTDITVSDIGLSSAIVSWKSNVVASSRVVYGTSLSYGGEETDLSNSQVTNHTIRLKGLTHSTTYHVRIKSTDAEGNLLQSDDYAFDTLKMPTASKIIFQPVPNQPTATMDVTWETNVTTTSVVFYRPESESVFTETAKAALDTKHAVRISALQDDTPYVLTVGGRDGFGNAVAADTQRFHTATDSRPPIISNVTIETQVQGNAEEAKAQVIVSWNTDEPGSSQVEYGPGLSADSYPNQTVEDGTLTNSHVVVISELKPAQTYHLRVKTHDRAGNASVSGDNVVITGRANSSVLNIILQNLQRTFGWLGGLGG